MTFDEKVASAKALIHGVIKHAQRPAIMCSFGKDSMVVLHLIVRAMGHRLPVIFHKQPFLPRKYRFSRQVISKWNLTVYDFPPVGTAVQQEGEAMDVLSYYPVGKGTCMLPTGIAAPRPGEPTLCALHDFYLRPTGTFNYPWDVVFHGHKSSDVDPVQGAVPLAADFARNIGSASPCFPLRHWTEADVCEYHKRFEVPIHHDRYEETDDGTLRSREDKTHNPDYFPACTACMKPGGGPVPCPRLGGAITANVAAQLNWAKREFPVYIEQPKEN